VARFAAIEAKVGGLYLVDVHGGASTVEDGACGCFLSRGGGSVAGLRGRVDGGTRCEMGAGGEVFLL
jgi:hypothetical protein